MSLPPNLMPMDTQIAQTYELIHTFTTMEVRAISHKWGGLRTFAPDHEARSAFLGLELQVNAADLDDVVVLQLVLLSRRQAVPIWERAVGERKISGVATKNYRDNINETVVHYKDG